METISNVSVGDEALVMRLSNTAIQNDERYQLDATIMIYYYKYFYMFRASICI